MSGFGTRRNGKFTDKSGKTTYYRTLNVFYTPKKYRYVIEQRVGGADWVQTGSGVSEQT